MPSSPSEVRQSPKFAGALVAERHGIPHARVALGLADVEEETIALVAAAVDELRSELDLEADPCGDRLRDELCPTSAPAALDVGALEFVRLRRPRATTPPLPDWWPRCAEPVVYVSFGWVAAALGFSRRSR